MGAELAYQENYERYEIVNGESYMMSRPSVNHQRISKNVVGIFDRYLDGKRCEAILEEDVYFNDDNNFIPDVMIVCNPDIVEEDGIHGVPDLVVEIISKSTAERDRNEKFAKYEKFGVKEYWIVDPFMRCVDVYHLVEDKFVKSCSCQFYNEKELTRLSDKEKEEIISEIKVSLYDDFIVQVKDIFKRVK